jgi:hypothetical protein
LKLPIYNHFQHYQYVDVVLSLSKRLMIATEVAQFEAANPLGDSEPVRKQLE